MVPQYSDAWPRRRDPTAAVWSSRPAQNLSWLCSGRIGGNHAYAGLARSSARVGRRGVSCRLPVTMWIILISFVAKLGKDSGTDVRHLKEKHIAVWFLPQSRGQLRSTAVDP